MNLLIQPLGTLHDRQAFDCGDADLNRWLVQVARQHKDKRVSSTFVAVDPENGSSILGYYAISLAELLNAELPSAHRKRLPLRVPVFRLGRLAVDHRHQGRGLGEFLLFDALDRATRVASEIGGVGLVVNAKPGAVAFYQRYGFEVMADHPLNLFLTL